MFKVIKLSVTPEMLDYSVLPLIDEDLVSAAAAAASQAFIKRLFSVCSLNVVDVHRSSNKLLTRESHIH